MRKAFKILAVTTLALTLALPFTAYASQWTQDAMGWKVRQDNGTYLMNQWYQNTDGKWYYIGADGYMMVNAITPDGYQVGADGAWIQPTQKSDPTQKSEPEVQPTQPQQSETHYEAGTTMKDANGNEVHKGSLSSNPTYSEEELKAINEIQFN